MSDVEAKPSSFVRVMGWALIVAFCISLVPILLLGLAYMEHVVSGTHRLKESLRVDEIVHELDAVSVHR
jgi:hypothetical protein